MLSSMQLVLLAVFAALVIAVAFAVSAASSRFEGSGSPDASDDEGAAAREPIPTAPPRGPRPRGRRI
jgi:hypothetical protein